VVHKNSTSGKAFLRIVTYLRPWSRRRATLARARIRRVDCRLHVRSLRRVRRAWGLRSAEECVGCVTGDPFCPKIMNPHPLHGADFAFLGRSGRANFRHFSQFGSYCVVYFDTPLSTFKSRGPSIIVKHRWHYFWPKMIEPTSPPSFRFFVPRTDPSSGGRSPAAVHGAGQPGDQRLELRPQLPRERTQRGTGSAKVFGRRTIST